MGMEAMWQGLRITLAMPQMKQPSAAMALPLVIHEFTTIRMWSKRRFS